MTQVTQMTPDDYIATLAVMTLLRAGCDHIPVEAKNLLLHCADLSFEGSETRIAQTENGYSVSVPGWTRLTGVFCSDTILALLLRSMGRRYKDSDEKHRFRQIFACHLLCPRPVLALSRDNISLRMLENRFGLAGSFSQTLSACPPCYVPAEMNARLAGQLKSDILEPSDGGIGDMLQISGFMGKYDDKSYAADSPQPDLRALEKAVCSVIPEHVLTKGHPASLYIKYTTDFEKFSAQFAGLDLSALYRSVFGETPPMPLLGGKPDPASDGYAGKMERYLSREASARIAFANIFYQRRYRQGEEDILTPSVKAFFAKKENDQ